MTVHCGRLTMEFDEIQSQMHTSRIKLHQSLQQVVLLNHTICRLKSPQAFQDGMHSPTYQPARYDGQPKLPMSAYIGLRDMYYDLATNTYAELQSQWQRLAELQRKKKGDEEGV